MIRPAGANVGSHFSCSMTAVLLSIVDAYGGSDAVAELLRRAGTEHPVEYLLDTGNWISYSEAVALWQAGAQVTHHPQFPRLVGEQAARRLIASPVADLLRSLGSPEKVYGHIATTTGKFSTVSRLEAVELRPGYAEIVATAVDGFPRIPEHCSWTIGLLSTTPILFGFDPADVQHEECAAFGAEQCRYEVRWSGEAGHAAAGSPGQVEALQHQLSAMRDRLQNMFATAADLIAADDVDKVLARITERAAVEVRAPRYLLSVSLPNEPGTYRYRKGIDAAEAAEIAERLETEEPATLPKSWLVVPVRSERNDYGRLLAMSDSDHGFFPQERDMLGVYARYAATALDSASALSEAKRLWGQSSELLELARKLAVAGTSGEVARRLADAVPVVVDCDRVEVLLWDEGVHALVTEATSCRDGVSGAGQGGHPIPGEWLPDIVGEPTGRPMLIDADNGHPLLREHFAASGAAATLVAPLSTTDAFLGLLSVSVTEGRERLEPTPDLLDRLSGVAAQATTALENGRLLDAITHQALHDSLTGLANRHSFTHGLKDTLEAASAGEQVTLFYIDLDDFKPVNDAFGHDVGDELLVAVADRLRACTRAEDTVARLGGDEFAILVGGTLGPPATAIIASRLSAAFVEPFEIAGHQLQVGASIGYASFPSDGIDAEELLRAADHEMFRVKRVTKCAHPRTGAALP